MQTASTTSQQQVLFQRHPYSMPKIPFCLPSFLVNVHQIDCSNRKKIHHHNFLQALMRNCLKIIRISAKKLEKSSNNKGKKAKTLAMCRWSQSPVKIPGFARLSLRTTCNNRSHTSHHTHRVCASTGKHHTTTHNSNKISPSAYSQHQATQLHATSDITLPASYFHMPCHSPLKLRQGNCLHHNHPTPSIIAIQA